MFNHIIDRFPIKILDQWFARGIKTAISDNPNSSVLKLLKFRDFGNATAAPYSTTVAEVGLNDAGV